MIIKNAELQTNISAMKERNSVFLRIKVANFRATYQKYYQICDRISKQSLHDVWNENTGITYIPQQRIK